MTACLDGELMYLSRQHWEATFVQLQPDQADALEWIHKALSSSVPPEYRAMGHWNS